MFKIKQGEEESKYGGDLVGMAIQPQFYSC